MMKKQNQELELLRQRVKKEKDEIIDCQSEWREWKDFYENGGDDKNVIVRDHKKEKNSDDIVEEKIIHYFVLHVNGEEHLVNGGN